MSASRSRTVRVVVLLIVAAAALVRYLQHHIEPDGAVAPRRNSKPDLLHLGSLTLTPCEIGRRGVGGVGTEDAYCNDFDVPEDWHATAGRHIKLRVAIVKSSAALAQSDLVTFLDGGPGGAATEDYPAIAPAFGPLKERHHILLVDQRGTGNSNALSCPIDSKDLGDSVQLIRQCLEQVRTRAAPEYYTTTDATRDLEAVRRALGAPLLDLYGVSYGTRMAQQYAGHYPDSVRSVVLDSTVPNALALGSEHARNLEVTLQSLFALCSANERCQQSFGDTYKTLYRLRDHLRGHPESVLLRDPNTFEPEHLQMTAEDLAAIVRFYAYSPVTAALLPLMLHEADHDNYEPLLSQKKLLSDSLGTEINGGMELSVICAEDADLLTARPEDVATLLGNSTVDKLKSACSVWPRGERPADFHNPWTSTIPVLILAGQYDPVTPPAYGSEVLKGLPNGRLLLAAGQGHAVIGAGCMPKLVGQFIDDLQPSKLDADCLKALGDTPAFIDFNGAAP